MLYLWIITFKYRMTDIIRKNAFRNGAYLGIILIIFSSYIYFFNLKLLTNVWFGAVTILSTVFMGIVSIISSKSKLNGLISFKESFSVYFFTIFTGSFILCIYLIILFSFVFTTEKIKIIEQILMDFNLYIMKLNYSNKDDIAKSIQLSKSFDPSDPLIIVSSAVKYLLRDCLIGFLVALAFRSKKTI